MLIHVYYIFLIHTSDACVCSGRPMVVSVGCSPWRPCGAFTRPWRNTTKTSVSCSAQAHIHWNLRTLTCGLSG